MHFWYGQGLTICGIRRSSSVTTDWNKVLCKKCLRTFEYKMFKKMQKKF